MRRFVVLAILATMLTVAACARSSAPVPPAPQPPTATATVIPPVLVSDPAPNDSGWDDLRRPFAIPVIPFGGTCPVHAIAQHTPEYGKGAGDGPFFVTMASNGTDATTSYTRGNAWSGDWGGQKTLWYADPAYQGRALIRGRRIDGPGEVRFDYVQGESLATELRVDTRGSRQPNGQWPSWIGATRFRLDSPGCYAFQVDGDTFTEVIIFRAVYSP